eukprot:2036874-Pleurochrysis_carterae.AAC.1
MFWTLHAGHMSLPGVASSRLTFATYRTDAALIDTHHARAKSQPHFMPVPGERVIDPKPAVSRAATTADMAASCNADEHAREPEVGSPSWLAPRAYLHANV